MIKSVAKQLDVKYFFESIGVYLIVFIASLKTSANFKLFPILGEKGIVQNSATIVFIKIVQRCNFSIFFQGIKIRSE